MTITTFTAWMKFMSEKMIAKTFKEQEQPKPSEGATIYRVQVGAYAKKENAENMLAKLNKDGYSGFIVEGKL